MKKIELKRDKFKHARTGQSRLYLISCTKCSSPICYYQKDGPGVLLRMYIDRIFEPKVSLTRKDLACKNGHIVAHKTIYEKENRPAFRLFEHSIAKKIVKNS